MRCSLRMPLFCCKSFSFLLLSVKEHSLICVLPSSYLNCLFWCQCGYLVKLQCFPDFGIELAICPGWKENERAERRLFFIGGVFMRCEGVTRETFIVLQYTFCILCQKGWSDWVSHHVLSSALELEAQKLDQLIKTSVSHVPHVGPGFDGLIKK